jgi:hypothetical protein
MARLIVKNVGPIKDIDIELKKVNVFMIVLKMKIILSH